MSHATTRARISCGARARPNPAHGPAMAFPKQKIQAYIDHRLDRERKILAAWLDGNREPDAIVRMVYTDVSPAMYGLAARSVVAHLEKLREDGKIRFAL